MNNLVGNVLGRWVSTKRHTRKGAPSKQARASQAPRELDSQALRLVGGGNGAESTQTPNKGW